MSKNWLKVLVATSAILIAGSAAYFSVTGLGVLFSGAAIAVMIMASSLEFAKLVTATYLKQKWGKIELLSKIYLTASVVILMAITSAGIFGYLSNAFQQQNLGLQKVERDIAVYQTQITKNDAEIVRYSTQLTNQQNIRNSQESNLSKQIDKDKSTSRVSQMIKSADKEITSISKRIDELTIKNNASLDSINVIKNNNIELEKEVGGFRFVAESFGVPLNSVVKFFIILIVIVFDPLAVALIISFNQLTMEGKKKDDDDDIKPIDSGEVEAKDLMAEVSRIRLSEQDLKKLEETLFNSPLPNEALKNAAKTYNEEVSEKHVHIDDFDAPPAFTEDELMNQYTDEMDVYEESFVEPTPTPEPTDTPTPTPFPTETPTPTPTPTYIDRIDVISNGGNFFNAPAEGYTPDKLEIPFIKEDDEISDWDVALMDGLEDEEPFFTEEEIKNIFQEEPTEEEIQGNFSTIEPETEIIFQEEPTTLESQDELKKKLLEIPQEDLVTTILVEASTSESQDFKENLYWESDDINPNQIIYDLENNKVIIPTSEEEIITEPTATPTPIINNILSRNVNPRRRNFR
jgi:hypothetical protein